MMPSVLIGCPVNEVKSYCIEDYLENISRLTYQNKKFYFVDNSVNFDWHFDTLICNGFDCDYVSPIGRKNQDYICECQNMIRRKCIDENFDYLLFLECDIFPKAGIIEEMLAYNAPIVACDYFVGKGERRQLLRMDIETPLPNKTITNRNISQIEGFLEYGTQKTRSKMFGFGCTLIRKDILMDFPFHHEGDSHSDTPFYFDIFTAGISVVNHPYICEHRNSSWTLIKDR